VTDRLPPITVPFVLEGLHPTDDTGDTWLGSVDLFGATYHVELVRVVDRDGKWGNWQVPRDAAEESLASMKYEAMQAYYDGRYQPAKVPGLEGEYAMFVVPYCD
jgi:hypothetical protein